jgi:hypothetical protein
MNLGFRMHAERTPNPNSIKWVLGQTVADVVGSASFSEAVATEISPLASSILDLDGVEGVYLGPTFITVTKAESVEWTDLAAPIVAAIKAWVATGASAFGPAFEPPERDDDDRTGWRRDRLCRLSRRRRRSRTSGRLCGLPEFVYYPQDGNRSTSQGRNSRGSICRCTLTRDLASADAVEIAEVAAEPV